MARGAGAQSSVAEQKAAAQLGLRDEQYILIIATHFPKLQMGSRHVQGNTLQKEWVAEIHGSPDL